MPLKAISKRRHVQVLDLATQSLLGSGVAAIRPPILDSGGNVLPISRLYLEGYNECPNDAISDTSDED